MSKIKKLFAPEMPPPPPLPPIPTPEDPEVLHRREETRLAARRRKGRSRTIATGGLGDTSEANVERAGLRTSLGG